MGRFLLLAMLLAIPVAILVAACGKDSGNPAILAPPDEGRCSSLPFAESAPVPEASGAAWITIDHKLALLVISDSGNDGAYAIVDPDSGETRETGKLPLGNGGEDLEGVAARGDRVFAVTSAGWIRVWTRKAGGFDLQEGPYPLGPVDLSSQGGIGDTPPAGTGMVCDVRGTNCGRNYEGLCLVDAGRAKGPCVGFAASKADGHLYCVVEQAGKLVVKHSPRIAIARPGTIGDCAFAEDGSLWVGSNLFDMGQVYGVEGWESPETAKVVKLAQLGIGFPETLAVRGDVFYRMSDTGATPSLMTKFRCKR